MIKIAYPLILICCLVANGLTLSAQVPGKTASSASQRIRLDGSVSLDSLTRLVHNQSGVRFSFNSVKVKGATPIYFPPGIYTLENILQRIRKTTSLYYSFYSGYVVFQDNPPPAPKPPASKTSPSPTVKPKNKAKPKPAIKKKETNKQAVPAPAISTAQNSPVPLVARADSSVSDHSSSAVTVIPTPPGPIHDTVTAPTIHPAAETPPLSRAKTSKTNRLPTIEAGLQWNLPLPFSSAAYYFKGFDGKNQNFDAAIPGVWLRLPFADEKNSLLLLIKPRQSFFTGLRTVGADSSGGSGPDTLVRKIKSLIKTRTFQAELVFNRKLNERWELGGGLIYAWQGAALLRQQSIGKSTGIVLADSIYGIRKSSADWKYLRSGFVAASLEGSYTAGQMQFGAAMLVPLSPVAKSASGKIRPINGEIFIRWRLTR